MPEQQGQAEQKNQAQHYFHRGVATRQGQLPQKPFRAIRFVGIAAPNEAGSPLPSIAIFT
jgi:hypothetical protein